ncbi:unnamed protein product, partial [Pylaiella littoralis]
MVVVVVVVALPRHQWPLELRLSDMVLSVASLLLL